MLPFTIDQFFGVFAAYNVAIWPAQVVAYGAAGLALWGIAARRPWGGCVAASVLAIFWLWNGIAYHLLFFSAINPAAYLFGAAFILQGLLFLAYGVIADRLTLRFRGGWHGALALALIIYAAAAYEVVGHSPGTAGRVRPCSALRHARRPYSPLACSCFRYVHSPPFSLPFHCSGRPLALLPPFCSGFRRILGSPSPA